MKMIPKVNLRRGWITAGIAVSIPALVYALNGTSLDLYYGGSSNNSVGAYANAVVGQYNEISSSRSLAVGFGNDIHDDDYGDDCMAVGYGNTIYNAKASIAVGYNNFVEESSTYSATFGRGNINEAGDATVVGKYNEPVNALFTVGNGIHSGYRSNALIVYENGDVVVTKVQGDISMGEFTTAP